LHPQVQRDKFYASFLDMFTVRRTGKKDSELCISSYLLVWVHERGCWCALLLRERLPPARSRIAHRLRHVDQHPGPPRRAARPEGRDVCFCYVGITSALLCRCLWKDARAWSLLYRQPGVCTTLVIGQY
jgi:hypothetical protein